MSEPWQDADDDQEVAWWQQFAELDAQWKRRNDRELRLMNCSLLGFNLGLALLAYSHYLDKQGWGYLCAAAVHVCGGLYALWQLWRPRP